MKKDIYLRDLIINTMVCIHDTTYMGYRIECRKELKKDFLICDTMTEKELFHFYTRFLWLYFRQM